MRLGIQPRHLGKEPTSILSFASTDRPVVIISATDDNDPKGWGGIGMQILPGSAVARFQISLMFIFVALCDSVQEPALQIIATQHTAAVRRSLIMIFRFPESREADTKLPLVLLSDRLCVLPACSGWETSW